MPFATAGGARTVWAFPNGFAADPEPPGPVTTGTPANQPPAPVIAAWPRHDRGVEIRSGAVTEYDHPGKRAKPESDPAFARARLRRSSRSSASPSRGDPHDGACGQIGDDVDEDAPQGAGAEQRLVQDVGPGGQQEAHGDGAEGGAGRDVPAQDDADEEQRGGPTTAAGATSRACRRTSVISCCSARWARRASRGRRPRPHLREAICAVVAASGRSGAMGCAP